MKTPSSLRDSETAVPLKPKTTQYANITIIKKNNIGRGPAQAYEP
jgi:hypothetical protein